jgi:hypothetical protein
VAVSGEMDDIAPRSAGPESGDGGRAARQQVVPVTCAATSGASCSVNGRLSSASPLSGSPMAFLRISAVGATGRFRGQYAGGRVPGGWIGAAKYGQAPWMNAVTSRNSTSGASTRTEWLLFSSSTRREPGIRPAISRENSGGQIQS